MFEKVILIKIVFLELFPDVMGSVRSINFPFFAKNALKSLFFNLFKNQEIFRNIRFLSK